MAFDARVVKVFIASPGDTSRERDAIEDALHEWNGARAQREKTVLVPWRWERRGVAELGETGQSIIDRQGLDECDLVIAVFNAYLGTATDDAVSGTAHEILRAHADGKPVHVYFSSGPLPNDIEVKELERLRAFKRKLEGEGLLGSYLNENELQSKVRNVIEHDLERIAVLGDTIDADSGNGAPSTSVQELIEIYRKYQVSADSSRFMDMIYTSRRIIRNTDPAGKARQAMTWGKTSDKLAPFDPNNPPVVDLVSYARSVSGSAELADAPRKCSGTQFAIDLKMDPPLRIDETIDFSVRGVFPKYSFATATDMLEATPSTPLGRRDFDYASYTVTPPTKLLRITVDLPAGAGIELLGSRSAFDASHFPAMPGPVAVTNEEYSCTEVVENGIRYYRMQLDVRKAKIGCRYRLAWRLP